MIIELTILKDDENKKVQSILKRKLGLSTRMIRKLKNHQGSLLLNDMPVYANQLVKAGDVLKVNLKFDEKPEKVVPEPMDLDILYEDDLYIAINKPAGIVIHPTYNYPQGTLANGLAYYYQNKNEKCLIRPVSRLDKDTTGVVLFAKSPFAHAWLSGKIHDQGYTETGRGRKSFIKKYWGIVSGVFNPLQGKIELPIKRLEGHTIERTVAADGEYALTLYKTIDILQLPLAASLVEFELVTGRTHQIRVHCMYSGHPLLGESLYNKSPEGLLIDLSMNGKISRQLLHAKEISFIHPVYKTQIVISSELPADMKAIIETGQSKAFSLPDYNL